MAIRNAWQLALSCIKLCFHFTERFFFKQCVSMTKTPGHFATYEQRPRLLLTYTLLFLYRTSQTHLFCSFCAAFVNYVSLLTLYKFVSLRQGTPHTKSPHFFCNSHKSKKYPSYIYLYYTFSNHFSIFRTIFSHSQYFPSSSPPFVLPFFSILFSVLPDATCF